MTGKRKYIILFASLIILVVIISVLANKWRDNVEFNKITISGNYTLTREEILSYAKLDKDSTINIEELNLKMIQDRISKNPEIKKVFVSKEPPSELKIDIIEKRPVAILNVNDELKLIDEELEIFPFKNYQKIYDLPVVTGYNSKFAQPGDSIKNTGNLRIALFIILNALQKSKTLYNLISEINISDSSKLIVYSNENLAQFYFPKSPDKNISNKQYQKELLATLVKFNAFHHQINLKENFVYVDLRFNGQAIAKLN